MNFDPPKTLVIHRLAVAATFLVASPLSALASAEGPGKTAEHQVRVYHVAQTSNANDANPGTAESPLRTINQAAQLAQPGDTVLVHEGVYREWVRPARGGTGPDRMITYRAAEGERVYIRGSKVFSPKWRPAYPDKRGGPDLVKAVLPDDLFEPNPRLTSEDGKPILYNPFATPLNASKYRSPKERFRRRDPKRADFPELVVGQVFVRGKPMRQVRTLAEVRANRGTWCAMEDGRALAVHFTRFTRGPVELAVRHQVFAPVLRGLQYIRVRGFVIEHAANQGPFPQAGMLSPRSGRNWIIEQNVIRYAATVGIDVGGEAGASFDYVKTHKIAEGPWAEGVQPPAWELGPVNSVKPPAQSRGHVVRDNVICDNGLSGISGIKADDVVIEHNLIERNNRRRLLPGRAGENPDIKWEEAAGIKLHCTKRTVIRGNLVRDNFGLAPGIWLDNNNDACRIIGNVVLNNGWAGIDLEVNSGPANFIDNNIVAFNRGDGLSSRSSKTVRFRHNLSMYNGRWGCFFTYRGPAGQFWGRYIVRPKHCEIRNNVFIGNQIGAVRFLMPREDEPRTNRIDGNLIGQGQIFQLAPDAKKGLTAEEMIRLARKWLTEANVPKDRWPDFADWSRQDVWFRGYCGFDAFNAIVGGPGNRYLPLQSPQLWERLDRFRTDEPVRYPLAPFRKDRSWSYPEDHSVARLKPGYRIELRGESWSKVRVERVSDVKEDYFGRPITGDKVLPGPFQAMSDLQSPWLELWPPDR